MIEVTRTHIIINNLYKILKCNALSEIVAHEKILNALSALDFFTIFGLNLDLIKICLLAKFKINTKNFKNFLLDDKKFWIDKETRNSLFNLLNSLDETSDFDLIVGDEIITLPVSKVKDFLILLEQYASACKVQTLKHINNIKDIKDIEDLVNYDYTLGYPKLINLNDFIN